MSNSERSEQERIVAKVAAELGEHYDTVQIFCSKHDGGGNKTLHIESGVGNFYARFGQVFEWLKIEQSAMVSETKEDE